MDAPSGWVLRWAPSLPARGTVLDLACGSGRHTRFLRGRGHRVVAVDRDLGGVADLADDPAVELVAVDLEDGRPFPLADRGFDGVVVTRYLHRPLLPALVAAVAPGGLLIYETFARGHERLGRPTNPDFLLLPGELYDVVRGELRVLAYEDLVVAQPKPAAIQRICARREPPAAPAP
jgi:SAM-dependent methyltransferase